jgi:site-specific recombinase XerD
LRRRLTRFADYAGERSIAEVTVTDIEAFLTSLNVAEGTWNTYRRDLVTLWSYATKAGLSQFNEALKATRAQEIDKPPGILTPSKAEALLKGSTDTDVRALHPPAPETDNEKSRTDEKPCIESFADQAPANDNGCHREES